MGTKKTASEQATRTSATRQPAKKPTLRAKKQADAPKAVRSKTHASAPKVVRAKKPGAVGTTAMQPASVALEIEQGMAPEERRHLIAEAAYLRAESRGFAAGGEAEDWLAAEQEIDGRLRVNAPR